MLPVPAHYDPERVGEVWRVPYEERVAACTTAWRDGGVEFTTADEVIASF